MSFVVGSFYKCIDETGYPPGHLTVGKSYECFRFGSFWDEMDVVNDNGDSYTYSATRFDPTPQPVPAMTPKRHSVTVPPPGPPTYALPALRAAQLQINHLAAIGVAMGTKQPSGPPSCTCGAKARKVEFHTFSYFYCDTCKDEVKLA